MNKSIEVDGAGTMLDAVIVQSLVNEFNAGRDPLVDYRLAHPCLIALGRPLTLATVKDLAVDTRTVGGRSVARLGTFLREADDYLGRRLARPNLKRAAAAKARAARGKGAAV